MVKKLVNTASLIVGLATMGYAAAGGGGFTQPMSPVVWKTAVDFDENVLVISGHHFGPATPTVNMAGYRLGVLRFTNNEIVASLPTDIEAATYGLTVINNRSASDIFTVAYVPRLPGKTR